MSDENKQHQDRKDDEQNVTYRPNPGDLYVNKHWTYLILAAPDAARNCLCLVVSSSDASDISELVKVSSMLALVNERGYFKCQEGADNV
jgi:hypothetical protein